ncbi:MAG: hypothetical protein EBZ20_07695 [Rhodobacteraceae bacterium]|nr:hypothetical protein [Paracoccaceae bacterium]
MTYPILYSFRRCPYAMRARLAIASSGIQVELREIVLRDKTPEFLETSPTATVPCLKVGERSAQPWEKTVVWLQSFKDSARFAAIMDKYPKWVNGDAPTYFPYQD